MAMMNFSKEIQEESKRLPNMEHLLGKSAMQPFANTNSGSRKIMFEIQLEHALPLLNPEVPIIQTGYENRYGDESSSIIKAPNDLEIVDKIYKFESNPNHHYYLITRNLETGEFDYIERKCYYHSTEAYGYLYNNSTLDVLDIGYEVKSDEILRTSYSFDEYMNRCDGVNLLTGYIGKDKSMEDGIEISETAAKKLASPLVREVRVLINDNDLLLNLFGNEQDYKSFPNIGENIDGGILCAVRREKTEECLYMQSIDRFSEILMSDTKYTVEGQIVDISVHCNNPETLGEKYSNRQVLYYYNDHRRFNKDIIESVHRLKHCYGSNIVMSNKLEKLYEDAKSEENGMQFMVDKSYSGTLVVFHVLDLNVPNIGDKITNRYGGKGVISSILPDELMPLMDNGERMEVCFNSSTCINRENPGQLMEMSVNYISSRLLEYINQMRLGPNWLRDSINIIHTFLSYVSPMEAEEFLTLLYEECETNEDREWYIEHLIEEGNIIVSNLPMSESMDLDTLDAIYKEFPFIKQYNVQTMIKDSNGNYRPVPGRRPMVVGKLYIYRLKQYAEEKFSVTSLSSTNIKNENTRNKANKNYKALHTNTPIRFGEMETGDFLHMGAEHVVSALMMHSVSPQARRLVESALTGNPYHVDIKLDSDSKNRNVEILNAYLKTMGLRLTFTKVKKIKKPLMVKHLMSKQNKTPLMTKVNPNEVQTINGKPCYKYYMEKEKEITEKYLMREHLMTKIKKPIQDKDTKE